MKARHLTVTGPKGTIKRSFRHAPIDLQKIPGKDGDRVEIKMWFGKKKQRCTVNTVAGHIKNMITGVTKGYRYKMKLAYEHFPINPVIEKPVNPKTKDIGKVLVLTKFLGENIVRRVEALEGVTIQNDQEKKKDEIVVEGIDLEATSKTCRTLHCD